MPATNFQKAVLYELDQKGDRVSGGLMVTCMFNPYEYEVTKTNSYTPQKQNDADTPRLEFTSSGSQILNLSLIFDGFEENKDVSQETRKLFSFMMTRTNKNSGQGKKVPPPNVAFEWGVFRFRAVITQMTQTFTLFGGDGTPLRARVDVSFMQLLDEEAFPKQEPVPSGTSYERSWQLVAEDRLDAIAGAVYGDPRQWRRIAEYNHIVDPLNLPPGQRLRIPLD